MKQDPLQVTIITPSIHVLTPEKTPCNVLACIDGTRYLLILGTYKKAFKKAVKSALLKHLQVNGYYIEIYKLFQE